MRNETVERIVNLLFQDVEMTDEVQALYDETMSNCQERYQDMTSRGLSDDDAIAAGTRRSLNRPKRKKRRRARMCRSMTMETASRRISLSIRRILGASK